MRPKFSEIAQMPTNAITHGDDLVAPKQSKWFRVLSFIVFAVAFVTIALNYGKQDPGYINEAEVGAK